MRGDVALGFNLHITTVIIITLTYMLLDDNSGLYAGTLIFGHDENVSTGLSKVRFDEHTIILSELLIN